MPEQQPANPDAIFCMMCNRDIAGDIAADVPILTSTIWNPFTAMWHAADRTLINGINGPLGRRSPERYYRISDVNDSYAWYDSNMRTIREAFDTPAAFYNERNPSLYSPMAQEFLYGDLDPMHRRGLCFDCVRKIDAYGYEHSESWFTVESHNPRAIQSVIDAINGSGSVDGVEGHDPLCRGCVVPYITCGDYCKNLVAGLYDATNHGISNATPRISVTNSLQEWCNIPSREAQLQICSLHFVELAQPRDDEHCTIRIALDEHIDTLSSRNAVPHSRNLSNLLESLVWVGREYNFDGMTLGQTFREHFSMPSRTTHPCTCAFTTTESHNGYMDSCDCGDCETAREQDTGEDEECDCSSCRRGRGDGSDRGIYVFSYSYKPTPVFSRKSVITMPQSLTLSLTFGTEIELDSDDEDCVRFIRDFPWAYLKEDGSLDGDGVEFVTHPADLRWWREDGIEHLREAFEKLSLVDPSKEYYGQHIHIGRAQLLPRDEETLALFFTRGNEKSVRWVADRVDTSYAQLHNMSNPWGNGNRNVAVNPTGTTIEVRAFRTTDNPEIAVGRMAFLDFLIRFGRTHDMREDRGIVVDGFKELLPEVAHAFEIG